MRVCTSPPPSSSAATVTHLCDVDLGLLEDADRETLAGLAASSRGPSRAAGRVSRLRELGLVRAGADGRAEPGNWFLARHLATERSRS